MATAKEIRQLSVADLKGRVAELQTTLFDMKIKHRTGRLKSSAEIGKNKRDLARILTVLAEKEQSNG